jgi:hypothetical protein
MPSISTQCIGENGLAKHPDGNPCASSRVRRRCNGRRQAEEKKPQYISQNRSQYYSPSDVAERQRKASTFDETQYYEVDSRKLPFGSAAWWRQMQQESDSGLP